LWGYGLRVALAYSPREGFIVRASRYIQVTPRGWRRGCLVVWNNFGGKVSKHNCDNVWWGKQNWYGLKRMTCIMNVFLFKYDHDCNGWQSDNHSGVRITTRFLRMHFFKSCIGVNLENCWLCFY